MTTLCDGLVTEDRKIETCVLAGLKKLKQDGQGGPTQRTSILMKNAQIPDKKARQIDGRYRDGIPRKPL